MTKLSVLHLRVEEINMTNCWTACGKVIHPNHTRLDRERVTCEPCLGGAERKSYAFEISHVERQRKRLRVW